MYAIIIIMIIYFILKHAYAECLSYTLLILHTRKMQTSFLTCQSFNEKKRGDDDDKWKIIKWNKNKY